MVSKFSELPNDIIISVIHIESRRKREETRKYEEERMKYGEVVKHLNKVSIYDEFCPSIVDTFNRGGDGLTCAEIWVLEQDWINGL